MRGLTETMSDLYGVLGVRKGANPDEIKRAYRKEALIKHPDRGGSKADFQALQSAYDVLSDPQKRAHYDATGSAPQEGGGGPGFSGFPGGMPDLSSIFGSMFGGGGGGFPGGMPFFGQGGGGGGGRPGKLPRGPNKIHEIGVTLADLYKGKTFKLNMKRDILCGGCNGKGGYSVETCSACGGKGFRMRGQQMGPMIAMTQEPCGPCAQTGEKVTDTCDSCKGKRIQESESVLDVVIESGMSEGDRLTFPGQCSESPLFEAPGDVILVLRAASGSVGVEDPELWVRRGADLTREIHLTLAESLLGWERTLDAHPSGRPLHVVWKGGVVREGEVLRIQGWGMPLRPNGLGDLRLVCHVDVVDQCAWSEEQLRVLKSVWPDWKEPVATEESVTPGR